MRTAANRMAAGVLAGALLGAPPAFADVLDDVSVARQDATATIRLRLTGPVHYVRHAPAERGEILVVELEALAPEFFAGWLGPDEVKRSAKGVPTPPFSVRVTLGPECSPAPNPVCLTIRFARPVSYRVRLGEDRRSVVLEVPLAADGERFAPPGTAQ
jgi:hypothetical protein